MISANKLRNLSMLKIGKSDNHIKTKLMETALEGKDSCEFPYESITQTQKQELEQAGFNIVLQDGIDEWLVWW